MSPRRLAAALATTISLLSAELLTPADALATIGGANGRIAFVGNTGIFTMNANGTRLVQLTFSSGDVAPRWSPNGRQIAFSTGDRMFIMNANGSKRRELTVLRSALPPGSVGSPSWSPDGTAITFDWSSSNTISPDGIYVISADNTSLEQLSFGKDSAPIWSPNGTKIAFARYDPATQKRQLWVMNADGSNSTPLTEESEVIWIPMDWSPDGTKIVLQRGFADTEIFTMNSDGSALTQLTTVGRNFHPTWSPDGTKIGFASSRGAGLWTMNVDGSGQMLRGRTRPFAAPNWQPAQVTIRASAGTVTYNAPVTLTAHLVAFQTSLNQIVSIYRIPQGGPETLLAAGSVDGFGNFSITTKPGKKTVYVAKWAGDADHPAGGISDSLVVNVRARVIGHLSSHYVNAGRYHLYHFTSACPSRHRRCPTYIVSIAPNHAGERLQFTLQLRIAGRWRTALRFSERIPGTNTIVARFVYRNGSVIGVPTRVRAAFRGDADHLATKTPWSYFKVTR